MVFQFCLDTVNICHLRMHSARNHAFQGSEPFSSHFVRCKLVRMGTKYTILTRWRTKANTPKTQSKGKHSNYEMATSQQKHMEKVSELWYITCAHTQRAYKIIYECRPLSQSMARVSRVSKLEEILREELGTTKCKSLGFASGGCINEGQSFDTDQGKIFVKLNEKSEVRTPKDFRDLLRGISVRSFPWDFVCFGN